MGRLPPSPTTLTATGAGGMERLDIVK